MYLYRHMTNLGNDKPIRQPDGRILSDSLVPNIPSLDHHQMALSRNKRLFQE